MASTAWAMVDGIPDTQFGYEVASMGDVTGDGLADLTVVTPAEELGTDTGGVYLLPSPLTAGLSGAGQSGVRFVDRDPGAGLDSWGAQNFGSMHPVPDLNGDGLPELLLASQLHRPVITIGGGRGTAYVVESPVGAVPGAQLPLDPSYAWFTGDDVLDFAQGSAVGELTGDAVVDLVLGSPLDENEDGGFRGAVYIFNGPIPQVQTNYHDASFSIYGDNPLPLTLGGPLAMGALLAMGDLTADGVADLVVSSSLSWVDGVQSIGEVYLFEGPLTADTPASAAIGTLQGDSAITNDHFGSIINYLGDTDGDGYGEFGAASTGGPEFFPIGHVYLYNGPIVGTSRGVDRADTHFSGLQIGDVAEFVASAGDLDEDGLDDVAISAIAVDGDARGAVLLYYGAVPRGSFPVNDAPDATLWGEGGWPTAIAASSDVDGDCMPDLVVGARLNDRVYVLQGGTL